ncbi:MAG TPA: NBR1-Ig-like domain-containing protein, partial [bacterium]|nr:NBR1-Ig-like domain-containing protein [bacterium]
PSLTFRNVGTNTWTSANTYLLRSRNPYNNTTWGVASVALPASVSPNTNVTFTPTFTAPITPGSYGFQWSMMRASTGTLFGDLSANVQINVVQGPNNAQFVSQTQVPTSVGPGTTFSASITMKNLGTATWDSTYKLISRGPHLNTNWGMSNIPVSGTVAQGANYTFTQSFTAPATPGTYNFRWRMAQGAGNTPFGQESPNVSIVVSADAAQYISKTGAVTVNAGQDFYVQYTMKNTGTTSWSTAAGYNMRSINPTDNTTWGRNRIYLPGTGSVAPGSSVTLTGLCTAPLTPGTYQMQWQMNKSTALFGEKTPLLTMTVVQGPNNAQYVSQTGLVHTVAAGATFNATITMKNLGTATWDATYLLVPIGSHAWGQAGGIASGSVAPNANGAFTATFTAPATPGTYTLQMRMSKAGTKFGQATPSFTITVT